MPRKILYKPHNESINAFRLTAVVFCVMLNLFLKVATAQEVSTQPVIRVSWRVDIKIGAISVLSEPLHEESTDKIEFPPKELGNLNPGKYHISEEYRLTIQGQEQPEVLTFEWDYNVQQQGK